MQFNDVAAQAMACRMGLDAPDDERLAILRCPGSCEVQAGPGSGKTTLLALKLALLAEQWPEAACGICVLSHTNAARNEIEGRLAQSATLRRLLDYPHFVGTFQKFVDQFLALPLLRQKGIQDPMVDNECFGQKAWTTFQRPGLYKAKGWLKNRDKSQHYGIIAGLRFADNTLRVESAQVVLPGSATDTYKQLAALKYDLATKGFFRFDDMFALAELALTRFPYLRPALRRRFPWVFIDELQDTSDLQGRLINDLFSVPDCVVQCFGDRNQAIFDFDAESVDAPMLFDQRPLMPLSSSRRFGSTIAGLASPFTAARAQTVVGFAARANRANTIFLFNRATVAQVVPRFAELVLAEVPPALLADQSVCVVGRRRRIGEMKGDHFPVALGDYWTQYDPEASSTPRNPNTLLGYVAAARCGLSETKMGAGAGRLVFSGILALLAEAAAGSALDVPKSQKRLKERLTETGTLEACQLAIWRLVNPHTPLTSEVWRVETARMLESMRSLLPSTLPDSANQFLAWTETASGNGARPNGSNIYLHRSGTLDLPIRFETVHAVKGETHAATLLVETYFRKSHDLQSLLPVLTGHTHGSQLPATKIKFCMCAFVAMTRPAELLCLALFQDHVPAMDIPKLKARGWNVEIVA